MENYLTLSTPSGPMEAFVVAPENKNSTPVIIVLQEIFGVNEHIKDICRRLAALNYLAIAPELFHRMGTHVRIPYDDRDQKDPLLAHLKNKSILEDVSSTIKFVSDLPYVDNSRIFTLGFCIGGFSSILCSTELPLTGAISFYGAGLVRERKGVGVTPIIENLKNIKCPLLLFFGGADVSIPSSDRKAITDELSNAEINFESHIYEDSDHGFFCDQRRSHHQVNASAAWKKTLEWLEQQSKGSR